MTMFHPVTTQLDPYLDYLWQTHATDLHLSVGSEAKVRIDGKLISIPEAPAPTQELMIQIVGDLLTEGDQETFEDQRQLDFSFGWRDDTARFRGNAFFQLDRLSRRSAPRSVDSSRPATVAAASARGALTLTNDSTIRSMRE